MLPIFFFFSQALTTQLGRLTIQKDLLDNDHILTNPRWLAQNINKLFKKIPWTLLLSMSKTFQVNFIPDLPNE